MNKIFRKSDLEPLKQFEKYLYMNGENPLSNGHQPTADAMLKWCSILEAISCTPGTFTSMMDAGCGPSNLSIAIKALHNPIQEMICIDWERISFRLTSHPLCKCFQGDFFDACSSNVKDEQLDIIIDACSVTHFDTHSNYAPNDGCYRLSKEAMRILKPGGYYFTTSDFSLGGAIIGEFVCVPQLIESYEAGGLFLVGDKPKFITDDAFVSNEQLNLGVVRLVFQKR
jgi:SAM-dependent methyltransferase